MKQQGDKKVCAVSREDYDLSRWCTFYRSSGFCKGKGSNSLEATRGSKEDSNLTFWL